jgi:hypothetical protein
MLSSQIKWRWTMFGFIAAKVIGGSDTPTQFGVLQGKS